MPRLSNLQIRTRFLRENLKTENGERRVVVRGKGEVEGRKGSNCSHECKRRSPCEPLVRSRCHTLGFHAQRVSEGLEGVLSGWFPANSVLRNALCHPKETSSLAKHGNICKIVRAKEEKLRFCSAGNAAEKRLPLTQKRTRKRQTRVRRLLVFAH